MRKCLHLKTKEQRAVKTISKKKLKKDEIESIKSEIGMLTKLDHPNVLKIYESFEENSMFHIITELLNGEELFEHITK